MNELSALIAAVSGIALSLLFEYIPGLSPWYEKQTSQVKRLTMLGVSVLVGFGLYAVSCWQIFNFNLSCDVGGVKLLVGAFILTLGMTQNTHLVNKILTGLSK